MLLPIDIHTHLNSPSIGEQIVINGTSPNDWGQIAELARQKPNHIIPAFGVHPWFLENLPEEWLSLLKELLSAFPTSLLGEIGLDKSPKATAPMPLQQEVFLTQWRLSREMNRPAVLHCVKAWHILLPLLSKSSTPFLCHAFNGSKEMIPELLDKNAFFSFGPRELLSPRTRTNITLIPRDKYLLESDGAPLEDILFAIEQTTNYLNIPTDSFIDQAMLNAQEFLSFP